MRRSALLCVLLLLPPCLASSAGRQIEELQTQLVAKAQQVWCSLPALLKF